MQCPKCKCLDDKVIDTRISKDGESTRRRRECSACAFRFTTYEMIVRTELVVVKRDGAREEFNPRKLRQGIAIACRKRPVSEDQIDEMVKNIVAGFDSLQEREVSSEALGAAVMAELQKTDEVAYVRFASVYRHFTDVEQFTKEIIRLSKQSGKGARK